MQNNQRLVSASCTWICVEDVMPKENRGVPWLLPSGGSWWTVGMLVVRSVASMAIRKGAGNRARANSEYNQSEI